LCALVGQIKDLIVVVSSSNVNKQKSSQRISTNLLQCTIYMLFSSLSIIFQPDVTGQLSQAETCQRIIQQIHNTLQQIGVDSL